MPKAANEDIIELTEVVEEGHPETPNLSAAKATPASREDALDDLDLEKEIDQIFADLNAPEETPGQGHSPRADGPEHDALDFDDLFTERDNQHNEDLGIGHDADNTHSGPPSDPASTDTASPLEHPDDFEQLFAEETRTDQVPEAPANAKFDPPATRSAPGDEPDHLVESVGDDLENVQDPMDRSAGDVPDTEVDASLEEFADVPSMDAQDQPVVRESPEQDPLASEPVDQELSDHNLEGHETAGQDEAVLSEPLLHRLQSLEDRLSELEQREQSPSQSPETLQPDAEQLLARIDERIAAAPVLIQLTKAQESFEGRLAGVEEQQPPQPDIDDLMTRLDSLQQAVDGMDGLAEAVARKLLDSEVSRISESMTVAFEQQLEQHFEQRLTERLEVFKATIIDDIERHLAAKTEDPTPASDTEAEDPRMAELIARLDELQEQMEMLRHRAAEDAPPAANQEEELAPLLQAREEDLETRLLETIRQDMEAMRLDWEGQKNALAKDLENSLNYWTKLQDKFKSLQGEWQTLREEREMVQTGSQEDVQDAPAAQAWQDELGDILDSRLDSLRTELHAQLVDEMHKAVPLAAAQIIREEIQALTQEEDEEKDEQP